MPRLLPAFFVVVAALLAGCSTSGDRATPAVSPPPAASRDAYVLLSGGGTPLSNNYSQYLQARALAEHLGRTCPPEAVWIFFGAGNRPDAPLILADARRETRREGLVLQSWEPGVLPRNRAATRDNFLRALRDEILPRVRDGGTLHLFVGDHGELAGKGDARESAITMWQLKPGRRGSGWVTDDKEILGVAELRRVLAAGLGRGRVVFCMTQCHSGGFHELGVAREPVPPREWFARVPAWAAVKSKYPRLPIAGFTATDEDSLAAGCDADPIPERWAGYERFLPEAILGRDLMTGAALGSAAPNYTAAHEAATLVDRTIDKPRATSDHLLDGWARFIETRLAATLEVNATVLQAVAAYQRAVDTGRLAATDDPALRARQAQFARFTARLAEQAPAAKDLLLTGTRAQLDATIRGRGERPAGGGPRGGARRGQLAELRKVWTDTLRPAWKAAVLRGDVPGLAGGALDLEKHLLALEDGGRDFFLPRGGGDALINEIYWRSGYAHPATLDRPRAEAAARWGAERRTRIVAWGRASADPAVRAAAEKIGPAPALADEPARALSRQTAAERVLFYRRALAAWEFLLATGARDALAEIAALTAIEGAPLPRVGAN
ncbi:MAG: hypothetical protein JNK23_01060 [Opitutaceae bacterium]|nr:hypothetical protein [Opitutaceae bacterium]